MTIDHFTKQDFESYLENHSPFTPLGLIDGEYQYNILLDNQVSITIRSSVKSNGLSADVASDSIRAWLVSAKDGSPLGGKTKTHRQPGWERRLNGKILNLIKLRSLAGDCPDCDKPKGIFTARTKENKGRPFAKCRVHDHFMWLDKFTKKDLEKIYFSEESGNGKTKPETIESVEKETRPKENTRSAEAVSKSKLGPNPDQKLAIEAKLNQNTRVLAGPGSGKTFVIEYRYKYLVENGVNPDNILVCTFSKDMADEMGRRIQKTCSSANLEQISTIHAFCYRVLCRWDKGSRYFGWKRPPDWQVKSELEDIVGLVWQEKEKPNSQEVLDAINTSKYFSLTADDSYEYFVSRYGRQYGEWLYTIRCKLDAWLNKNRFITFNDMIYLIEKQLQTDESFRSKLQARFSQIIIDEAQDTNAQAMRILVTVSLEPGKNMVYEEIR